MRLIDADRLKAYLQDKYVVYDHTLADIDAQPTVDAEPVRHGRWIKNGDRYCECSVCHHEGNTSGADYYCSNCGAKMDTERKRR